MSRGSVYLGKTIRNTNKSRLSFKQLVTMVEEINKRNNVKYANRGYLYMNGDSGWYEIDLHHVEGSSACQQLVRGTLRDCYDYLRSHSFEEYKREST